MKQAELVTGKKQIQKELTFWTMWDKELPASFSKMKFVHDLMDRWGLAYSNVLARLKKEEFVSLKMDMRFMYDHYGIAFDFQGKGFFLDKRQYDLIQERNEMENAKIYNLSKSFA